MGARHPSSGLVRLAAQLLHRLGHLKVQLDELGSPCVKDITWRPKEVSSVQDKTKRNKLHIAGPGDLFMQIDDLVGIRVVCHNLRDVYKVVHFLRRLPMTGIDVSPSATLDGYGSIFDLDEPRRSLRYDVFKEQNRISNPTKAGYRAYHLYLRGPLRIKVPFQREIYEGPGILEVQVRTMAQDLWSILSHRDFYKKEADIPKELRKHMRVTSDYLYSVDRTAQLVANGVREPRSADVRRRVVRKAVSTILHRHFDAELNQLELDIMMAALKIGQVETLAELIYLLSDPIFEKRVQFGLDTFYDIREARVSPLVFRCVLLCLMRREKRQKRKRDEDKDVLIGSSVLSPAGRAWPAYVKLLSEFF